jgi:hypothetical protein
MIESKIVFHRHVSRYSDSTYSLLWVVFAEPFEISGIAYSLRTALTQFKLHHGVRLIDKELYQFIDAVAECIDDDLSN